MFYGKLKLILTHPRSISKLTKKLEVCTKFHNLYSPYILALGNTTCGSKHTQRSQQQYFIIGLHLLLPQNKIFIQRNF